MIDVFKTNAQNEIEGEQILKAQGQIVTIRRDMGITVEKQRNEISFFENNKLTTTFMDCEPEHERTSLKM